ncbi:hypothetical protein [Sinimarinibacterium sp. NLF-5-8]|uniref:hypothetical protein n=1 Tax=Sinimarinibacterium sp. NLF-5-8 TaxID=2698684 RepID=UPI00137C0E31|nr:hypothetical protein [Sinimarinibacterium sp. NLF-5-8]QHS09072.1 hypothetical protein GT972_02190 [Sinimarinibacterium sp. NLF-5-8]
MTHSLHYMTFSLHLMTIHLQLVTGAGRCVPKKTIFGADPEPFSELNFQEIQGVVAFLACAERQRPRAGGTRPQQAAQNDRVPARQAIAATRRLPGQRRLWACRLAFAFCAYRSRTAVDSHPILLAHAFGWGQVAWGAENGGKRASVGELGLRRSVRGLWRSRVQGRQPRMAARCSGVVAELAKLHAILRVNLPKNFKKNTHLKARASARKESCANAQLVKDGVPTAPLTRVRASRQLKLAVYIYRVCAFIYISLKDIKTINSKVNSVSQ